MLSGGALLTLKRSWWYSFIKPVVVMGLQIELRSSTISEGGNMPQQEELRVISPEQLPDLVPLGLEAVPGGRARSQSVNIPPAQVDVVPLDRNERIDRDSIREIGRSLRRFSNEFENRHSERNGQSRRSSLTSFLNWRS